MADRRKTGSRRGQPPRLSRREFLAGTTAAGLTVGLPGWLIGCGSDSAKRPAATPTPTATAIPTPTPIPQGPREDCTLQFDLSFGVLENPRLRVFNSDDNAVRLQIHTAESRAHFRDQNPVLAEVPDANLTHFVEDVDLPADALQLFWVTGNLRDSDEPGLAGCNIHVPTAVSLALAQSARARGRRLVRSAKMHYYNLAAGRTEAQLAEDFPALASFVTPFDVAAALVFLQPEILNLNLEQGGTIKQLIETLPCSDDPECLPFLSTLAAKVARGWPANESGFNMVGGQMVPAWAKLVPVTDPDTGEVILDRDGKPALRWDPTEDVARTAASVARAIRKHIFDDGQFEGSNWHPTRGLTARSAEASVAANGGAAVDALQLVGEHAAGTTAHGVEFVKIGIVDQAQRTVEVELRNHFLRYLSAYVQFANEGGDLPLANPEQQDTQRARFLQLLNSNYTVLGIPLIGDTVEKQTLRFNLPVEASKARLYFGSLGLGGDAFSPEALQGSVVTLTFNIGIPTLLLAAGVAVGAAVQKSILGFLQSGSGRQVIALIVTRVIALAGPAVASGIFGTGNSGNAAGVLTSLGTLLAQIVLSSGNFAAALVQIGVSAVAANVATFIGPLGVAFRVAAALADVATIAQSVAEVLGSPAIFTNLLSAQMRTTVTIEKDPTNSTFPALARTYEVTLIYDQASKLAHKVRGTLQSGHTAPIVATFEGVPSGGMVTIDVVLSSEDGWIVGRPSDSTGNAGPIGPIPNTPEQAGAIAITLKELLIPLTQRTQYRHLRKLSYEGSGSEGHRVWVDGPAPTATRAVLCQGQDDRLCDLTAITISQRRGVLGYSYRAGNQGVVFCGEVQQGVAYMAQNVSTAADADRALKQLRCGFRQPVGILYDRLGATGEGLGRNFFLQPTPDGFYLQTVFFRQGTPFDVADPFSWGRFSDAMDALAVHPMGYVVGVNRQNHKMEILQLPPAPVNAAEAPNAVPFAVLKGGEGTRPGLLSVPVAVTVFDGTILVLEAGNQRVQAFDVSGNPVSIFKSGTASTFALADAAPNLTYLDLGVDGLGYMYVLAFVGGGGAVSDYRLDIYTPKGNFLTRTTGIAAGRFTVDTFRNVYTLNYESLAPTPRIEPSLSHWTPSTPR